MHRSKVHLSVAAKTSRKRATNRFAVLGGAVKARTGTDYAAWELDEHVDATERLKSFYEHSPLAVIEWSPLDLRVLRWSKMASRLFGWDADEAFGLRADELGLVSREDWENAAAPLVDLAQRRCQRHTSQQRNLCSDGSAIECEWHSSALSENGQIRSIVSLVLDVSERWRIQRDLDTTRAQLENMLEAMPRGLTVLDDEGRYRHVSREAARAAGKSPSELLGRPIWEIFPDVDSLFRSRCQQAMRKQKPTSFEHYSAKLGRWYDVFLYPLTTGLSVQANDITLRKRAEQSLRESERHMRLVLDHALESYAVYDADRRIEYLSPAALDLVKCELGDVIGKRDEDIWPEEVTRSYLPHLMTVYKTGSSRRFELDAISATGETVTKEFRIVPLKDSRGAVYQVVMATYDITESKRSAGGMATIDKNDFLALISHELRNPLTPLRYSLDVLDGAPPGSEEARQAKAIIDRQVERMVRLVDDLLDVTRISHGKIQLRRGRVDLAKLVQSSADDHRTLFSDKGLDLVVDIASAPMTIDADADRIAQVLGNLLQNAAKFTLHPGRVTLTLRIDETRGMAVVEVRDTGIGISPKALPRIFEAFEQAPETLERSRGGLGLGLALVKALVEMHDGEVEARSQGHGTGSQFIVRLPLATSAAPPAASAYAPRAAPLRRILVIDDHLDSASSLGDFLKAAGHEVAIAHDGQQGIDKARRFRPDLVFCDIGLPVLDGYRVARAFRSDKQLRSSYLVALTGHAHSDDRQRADAAGFDQYIAKPPRIDHLRRVLVEAPIRK